jgi:RHH-type transcriptional regulator, proline utilization regulon repressor / proline dehydrogenase / delta 1-pyrroline-5-carboxylate dehydrogenase
VYAPVGSHEDLLPYLVRRLLENGANSSFVYRIVDEHAPVEEIIADPVTQLHAHLHQLRAPAHSAAGGHLSRGAAQRRRHSISPTRYWRAARWQCARLPECVCARQPLIAGRATRRPRAPSVNPSRRSQSAGVVVQADEAMMAAGDRYRPCPGMATESVALERAAMRAAHGGPA